MVQYKENVPSWDESTAEQQLALVRAAAAGEAGAFSLLAGAFDPVLSYLIRAMGPQRAEAEDLRQEGLMGLYKACLLFDPGKASFGTFARVCMRSALVDAARRAAPVGEVPAPPEELPDEGADPQRILVDRERVAHLLSEMDKALSPLEKSVLKRRLRGEDSPAIAEALGLSRRTVDNALFRARAKLKLVDMPE